jgi:hypothetical protein
MNENSANRKRATTIPPNQPHPTLSNFVHTVSGVMKNKRKSSSDSSDTSPRFNEEDSDETQKDQSKISKRKTITMFDRTSLDRSLYVSIGEPDDEFPELSFPVIKIHHILSYKQQKRILKLTRFFDQS